MTPPPLWSYCGAAPGEGVHEYIALFFAAIDLTRAHVKYIQIDKIYKSCEMWLYINGAVECI